MCFVIINTTFPFKPLSRLKKSKKISRITLCFNNLVFKSLAYMLNFNTLFFFQPVILQLDRHLFVQHYLATIQMCYRMWLAWICNSSTGLVLVSCPIPVYMCCSESEGNIMKYVVSFPLKKCTSVHRGHVILETNPFSSNRIAWDLINTYWSFLTQSY